MSTYYLHDTNYYGCDIISVINNTLNLKPIIDRSGKYIWYNTTKRTAFYCDLFTFNNRGCLDVYIDGIFVNSIQNCILDFKDNQDDVYLNKDKLINFISNYM